MYVDYVDVHVGRLAHSFTHSVLTGTRGRSKKWKELLKLPPVSQCLYLKDEIGKLSVP